MSVILSDTSHELQLRFDGLCREIGVDNLSDAAEALETEMLGRGLTFGSPSSPSYFHPPQFVGRMSVDPIPRVLSNADWRTVTRAFSQRLRVFNKLIQAIANGSDEVVPNWVLSSSKMLDRSSIQQIADLPTYVSWCGSDALLDRRGALTLVEDNLGNSAGPVYGHAVSSGLARRYEVEQASTDAGRDELFQQLGRHHQSLCDSFGEPTMVYLTRGPGGVDFPESVVLAQGSGFQIADPEDLEISSNGDVLLCGADGRRRRVDLINYRLSPLFDFGDRLLESMRRGRVVVVNHWKTLFPSDKGLFAYIPEAIRTYLNEEPAFGQADTHFLREPADQARVFDSIREFVVKERDSLGGRDVLIGSVATDSEIAAFQERVQADPTAFVAQLAVDVLPTLNLRRGTMENALVQGVSDFRLTGIPAENPFVGQSVVCRTDSPTTPGIVNVSAGGGMKPFYLLGER